MRTWRILAGLFLVSIFLALPTMAAALQDSTSPGRLTGPEIMNLLEPGFITLLPPALFSLAAHNLDWVSQWGDIAKRGVIVGLQIAIAATVYYFRKSLDAQTVAMLLTAATGILTGLTVPAEQVGVSKTPTRKDG